MSRCLAAALTTVILPACGAGVIQSEDVTPTQAAVIALIVVAAFLYIAFVGRKK